MTVIDNDDKLVIANTEVAHLYRMSDASSATDWTALEEYLMQSSRAAAYATSLATVWADESDEPGFNQPAGSLVALVEDLTGTPVWK